MIAALPIGLVLSFALLAERTAQRKLSGVSPRAAAASATVGFAAVLVLASRALVGTWDLLPLAVASGFWFLPAEDSSPSRLAQGPYLASRAWPSIVAGFLTALSVAWIWGSFDAVPASHDEAAYLLQARIFATGHWTAPGRPLPEFFEQTHVFVTPVLASKYPPGNSLALVPGVWLGLPGLMPVLLYGLVGGLVFGLARRVAGTRVALLTWWIWLTAPGALAFRASYLSQSTSSALWLVGWFLLLRWRDSGRTSDLVALAVCTGLEFLTRPLTMLAFSIPVGVVVLREVWKRRAWRAFGLSIAAGAAVLTVIPLWSYETLGDWATTPYHQYSRVYYPYQWTGFTFDDTPSLRPYPPEMEPLDRMFRRIQHEHRLSAVPEIFEARLEAIGRDFWGGGRRWLVAFAVLGLLGASVEALFAVAAFVVLVLAYLVFAHSPGWSVYYMEGHPVLALATALGVDRVLSGLSNGFARMPAAAVAFGRRAFAALLLGGLILRSLSQMALARDAAVKHLAYQTGFRRTIAAIADRKSVVFVKYAAAHDAHRGLVSNNPDLATSRAWIVYDRGPRDEELMRLAPDRVAYVYDDTRRRLFPMKKELGR